MGLQNTKNEYKCLKIIDANNYKDMKTCEGHEVIEPNKITKMILCHNKNAQKLALIDSQSAMTIKENLLPISFDPYLVCSVLQQDQVLVVPREATSQLLIINVTELTIIK